MHSLSQRLLLSVAVPLALFFGFMTLVLDTGFRTLSEHSLHELLDSQIIALIAAAEREPHKGYVAPLKALDSRFATPRSGLYAQIRSARHEWRSPSTAGADVNFGPLLEQGERQFSYTMAGHRRLAIESRGVAFADDPAGAGPVTFSVAVSLTPYEEQLWEFRRRMVLWFSALMLLLLATLAVLLRAVLAPVRRLEREIHEVEEGRSEVLGGGYPRELSGVARHLNALLVGERKRVARYRDTLGNLAHSLKTPLAVMRSALSGAPEASGTIGPEIDRMSDIIEHQLKRAAASGGVLLGQAPVAVAPVAADLRAALLKVYRDKDLSLELAVQPESQFVGDRADLMEMLGNLLENACKWCHQRVRLSVTVDPSAAVQENMTVTVEDDGPGISAENRARVLERGVRTDETVPGHGLGLAMVRETVDLYGGSLAVDTSPLGGARFEVRLPGRV
ncbi:MAG: ATP-binding protein [Steroidobacteraceae bacterium]